MPFLHLRLRMRMKTVTTRLTKKHEMMNGQGRDITSVYWLLSPLSWYTTSAAVLMVPPHFRHRIDVCSNATNWLVYVLRLIGIVRLTSMLNSGMSSPIAPSQARPIQTPMCILVARKSLCGWGLFLVGFVWCYICGVYLHPFSYLTGEFSWFFYRPVHLITQID